MPIEICTSPDIPAPSGARPFPLSFRSMRLTQRAPAIIPREIRSVNFVNRPFARIRSSQEARRREEEEKKGGQGGKKGGALSAPQIAVYVSGGVGPRESVNRFATSPRVSIDGPDPVEIGRDARLT